MTSPRDPESLLAAYLTEGMDVLPDRVVEAVLDEAHRTRRRTVLRLWRTRSMFQTALGAAVVVAVALGGALFVIQRGQPAVGGPGPAPGPSASPSQVAAETPSATPDATPSPTPEATPSPTPGTTPAEPPGPTPTPFVLPGGRQWKVSVRNESSDPATLLLTDDPSGIGPQCGSVTPAVVPAGVTKKVTFLMPPKSVKGCWVWVTLPPDKGGSFFETSDAPMKGGFLIDAGGQVMWGGP